MSVTPQERFKAAVSRGMAASPFATTSREPLILITGSTRTPLAGCIIDVGDNKAQADEWGIDHVFTLDAHIPKSLLAAKPRVDLDAVEYQGRRYNLTSASGDEAHSPVWVIGASSPHKS